MPGGCSAGRQLPAYGFARENGTMPGCIVLIYIYIVTPGAKTSRYIEDTH